jgi:hypothetical protein
MAPPQELVAAVRAVAAGDAFLSPPVARRVIEAFKRRKLRLVREPAELAALTGREREVAAAVTALLIRSRSRRRPPPAGAPPPGWGGAPAPPQPPPQPVVSPDGCWRWDGERWVPNVSAAPQDEAPPARRDYPPPPGYR